MHSKFTTLALVVTLFLTFGFLAKPLDAQTPEAVLYSDLSDEPTAVTTSAEVVPTPKAGVTPTSPFYKLDSWIEKIEILLTQDPEEKIRKFVQFSQEKLAEIEKMEEAGEVDAVETATLRYLELGEEASDLFTNLAKDDPEGTKDVALLMALSNSKGQTVLVGVYGNADEANKVRLEEALKLNSRNIEDSVDYTPEQNREQVRLQVEEQLQETRQEAKQELKRYLPTIVPEKEQNKNRNN